jgi:hypothetical protein
MSFKNASVSALDAGGSRGTSCIVGELANCEPLPWRCISTFDPGSSAPAPSSAENVWGADVSVGV